MHVALYSKSADFSFSLSVSFSFFVFRFRVLLTIEAHERHMVSILFHGVWIFLVLRLHDPQSIRRSIHIQKDPPTPEHRLSFLCENFLKGIKAAEISAESREDMGGSRGDAGRGERTVSVVGSGGRHGFEI